MDTLSAELLVQIFSHLQPADFGQVSRICRAWRNLLNDENVWHAAFLSRWSKPPYQRLRPSSWRLEYTQRFRRESVWSGKLQLGGYCFKDVEGILDVRLEFDKRSLLILSKESLIRGTFIAGGRIERQIAYFSRSFDEEAMVTTGVFGDKGMMALGLENENLILVKHNSFINSPSSTQFTVLASPNQSSYIPVQKIDWITERLVLLVCRRGMFPTTRLMLWDIVDKKVFLSMEKNDVNAWLWQLETEDFYWSQGGSVYKRLDNLSNGWETLMFTNSKVNKLIYFARFIVATSLEDSNEICFLKSDSGDIVRRLKVSDSKLVCLTKSKCENYLLTSDELENAFIITYEEEKLEIRRISENAMPTRILDIAGDECFIFILYQDCLLVYDSISLTIVKSHPIPGKLRRISSRDLDEFGRLKASFVSFDSHGRILIQWGSHMVHLWNFGHRITQLDAQQQRTSSDKGMKQQSKAQISQDIREDLDAYKDECEVEAESSRIKKEYGVSGMSEAEMLQMAQILSMQSTGNSNCDDFDYELAMALSRSELDK